MIRNPSAVPTFDVLRQAIDCFHSIYRKWAICLDRDVIPTDMIRTRWTLVPEIEDDYSAQFSMMWKCLFDDDETK